MGTGQSRRLAKIVPTHAMDNGAEVLLHHSFVEWLSSPLLFPTEAVRALKVYKAMASVEAMGKALERALSKLQSDLPLSPAVLRGQLRRIAAQDADWASWTRATHDHTNSKRIQPPTPRPAPPARPRRAWLAAASLHDAAEFPPTHPEIPWQGHRGIGASAPCLAAVPVVCETTRLQLGSTTRRRLLLFYSRCTILLGIGTM